MLVYYKQDSHLLRADADEQRHAEERWHSIVHERVGLDEVDGDVRQRPAVVDTLTWPRLRHLQQHLRLQLCLKL